MFPLNWYLKTEANPWAWDRKPTNPRLHLHRAQHPDPSTIARSVTLMTDVWFYCPLGNFELWNCAIFSLSLHGWFQKVSRNHSGKTERKMADRRSIFSSAPSSSFCSMFSSFPRINDYYVSPGKKCLHNYEFQCVVCLSNLFHFIAEQRSPVRRYHS